MTTKGTTQNSSWLRIFLTLFIITLLTVPLFSGKETVVYQPTGAAIAQYNAIQYSTSQTVCAGAETPQQLVLRNQGTIPDTYFVNIRSDDLLSSYLSSFVSINQEGITLQPGEERTIFYYLIPKSDDLGSLTYELTITSLYSDTKTIEQTVTITECPNIDLKAYSTHQQTCPCSVGAYYFDLANTGTNTETYTLWLDNIEPAYYDLSEYYVTLQPGEHKAIYAYIRMACSFYGDFSFTLLAETAQSSYTAEIPLTIDILQACYIYNIALGEPLLFHADAPLTVTFTPKEDTSYVLCQEDPAVIPVHLQNPGEIMNEYHLFLEDSEAWIIAAEPYIKLKGGHEHTTSLVINTGAAPIGTYSFALKTETLRGDLQSVIPFTVEIQECGPDNGLPSWLKWTLIVLLCTVIAAIFIVGYILYTKKDRKGKSTKQHPAMVWASKNKHILWPALALLFLLLLIGFLAYPLVQENYEKRMAAGSEEQEEARIIPTLFYNWATALLVLAALVLLAFLLWHFKLRRKNKKTKNAESSFLNKAHERISWEKLKPLFKWLWIILLLLLLLSALTAGMYFLYKNYKEDANKFLTNENATTTTETTEETPDTDVQIKALQEQIASLEEKLLAASESAAQQDESEEQNALLEQIAALEEQIRALEKQLQALLDQQTVMVTENNTKDLEDRISALEEQIKALQALIATLSLEKQDQEMEDAVKEIQEEIISLEEEKEQLEAEETIIPEITSDAFTTILAFDVSLSGQIVENGMSRFDRGVLAAQQYIQEKGEYNVMIVGKNAIVVRRNVNSATALKFIRNLRPLDTQSNLGKALYSAAEQLEGKEGRIVLISDLQTTDDTNVHAIKRELEKQGIDVVFLNIAQKKSLIQLTTTEEIAEEVEQTSDGTEETTEPVQEAESVQESPIFTTESQTAGDFVISLPKNAVSSLDLQQYFSDADNDTLTYTVIPGEHLTASVEAAIALLSPEKDWTGETTIRFAADDGKGGVVESPVFNVLVAESTPLIAETQQITEEAPETVEETTSYIPWIILGSIIFLIILSLILGAFVKKFHNDPHAPEQKDEEKKE